jgi:hypothetical protein
MGSIRRFARLLAEGEREALAGLGAQCSPDLLGEGADSPDAEADSLVYGLLSHMERTIDIA